ncbi:MAG TPA: hypothetical protein PKY12_13515, partial [Catalimonadaceae bacterium]|nr:hypothetical protein [Catalimonadaceae bacterium]
RYVVLGISSRLCFFDLNTKSAKLLELQNLPGNRVLSSIGELNGYVYVGYRYGGLFKKRLTEIEKELSKVQ